MTVAAALAVLVQAVVVGLALVGTTAILVRVVRLSAARRADIWFGVLAATAAFPVLGRLGMHAAARVAGASIAASPPVLTAAIALIALGGAAALVAFAASFYALARLRARTHAAPAFVAADARHAASVIGYDRAFHVRIGPGGHSPLALGVRRPTIVLPATSLHLSAQDRELVVMHELAHLKRRDPLVHAAARALLVLSAFNPAAYLAARALGDNRELACDDIVVLATNEPRAYARALAHYLGIDFKVPAAVLGLLARPAFALRRMRHVLGAVPVTAAGRGRFALSAAVATGAAALFVWSNGVPLVRFVLASAAPVALTARPDALTRFAPAIGTLRFAAIPPAAHALAATVPTIPTLSIPAVTIAESRPLPTAGLPAPTLAVLSTTFARAAAAPIMPPSEESVPTVAAIMDAPADARSTAGRAPATVALTARTDAAPVGSRAFVATFAPVERILPRVVSFAFSLGGATVSTEREGAPPSRSPGEAHSPARGTAATRPPVGQTATTSASHRIPGPSGGRP
jgi:beta-lactamase regulating signal transducer with metallopeptidase domain